MMSVTNDQLAAHVHASLKHSRENGFFLSSQIDGADVERICVDMLDMDADLADRDIEQLRPHVTAFFRRTGQHRG